MIKSRKDKKQKKQTVNSCFFLKFQWSECSDLECSCNKVHETHSRISVPFPFPGEIQQRDEPCTAQGWSRWTDALPLPSAHIHWDAAPHLLSKVPPATSFPLLCTKATSSMKLFHHSPLIYLLWQPILSSCLKISTTPIPFLVPLNLNFHLHYMWPNLLKYICIFWSNNQFININYLWNSITK